MLLTFMPTRSDQRLLLEKYDEVLVCNGLALDFSRIADGDTLPPEATGCEWLGGEVTRHDGQLQISLILPHGADAPEETRYPAPLSVLENGRVNIPAYDSLDPDQSAEPLPQSDADIDWSMLSTKAGREAEAKAEWRRSAELPAGNLLFLLMRSGVLSEPDLSAWMAGQTPEVFTTALAEVSDLDRFSALMPLRAGLMVKRDNVLICKLAETKITPDEMDLLFAPQPAK